MHFEITVYMLCEWLQMNVRMWKSISGLECFNVNSYSALMGQIHC